MAGGTFTAQNKVLPGVYINYKSAPSSLMRIGERGTVAIARSMGWGEKGFTVITNPNKCFELTGYDITSNEMTFVRQMFLGTNRTSGANKILLWNLETSGGVKASVTNGNLTVTAKYTGTRGNDITVVITADPDTENQFVVQTLVAGVLVDTQIVEDSSAPSISLLKANDWVSFSGTGHVAANTGLKLTNGANGTVTDTAHSNFLNALETKAFNVVCYDGSNQTLKTAYSNFAKRLSNDLGVKCWAVVSSSETKFDIESTICTEQQSVTVENNELGNEELTWWVAGVHAGADVNQSLTNATYPGVQKIDPELSFDQQVEAINEGRFALINSFDECRVLSDINSFVSYTPEKGEIFSKNRSVRTVFGIANDTYATFAKYYVGSVDNDEDGRALLKSEIIALLMQYQAKRAIQNVESDDVEVVQGISKDSVVITIAVQLVDSVDKMYITITCS